MSDRRPKDKFGIAAGYAHVSSRAHALDVDFAQLMGPSWPLRSFESLATAVCQYEVRPGWTLQPNFQYFVHPGGGATSPTGPNRGKLLKDAAARGLKTVDGLGMLMHQAAPSFEAFFGIKPKVTPALRASLEKVLRERQ